MLQYQVRSDLTTTIDNYHEGLLNQTAEWIEEHTIEATDPREALKDHYTQMGHDINFDNIDGHRLYVSYLVDRHNLRPTEEAWKRGDLTL